MTLTRMSFQPFIALGLCLLMQVSAGVVGAQSPSPTAPPPGKPAVTSPAKAPTNSPKSQFNTNIYEASDDTMSFTDVVRVVRDYEGQSEVLFVKKTGVFVGPKESEALNRLIESQSNQTPVTVHFNEVSRQILRVLNAAKASGAGQ